MYTHTVSNESEASAFFTSLRHEGGQSLGDGAFSTVWKVTSKPAWASAYPDIVCSQLQAHRVETPDAQEKIENHMRVLAELNRLRGCIRNSEGKVLGYLADLMPGTDFYVTINGKEGQTPPFIPEPHRVAMLVDLAKKLKAFHDLGYIHGDLKPENAMCYYKASTGQVVMNLIDFDTAIKTSDRKRLKGGTPYYLPPEALDPSVTEHTDRWDVFSFGMICLEVIDQSLFIEHWYNPLKKVRETRGGSDTYYTIFDALTAELTARASCGDRTEGERRKYALILDMLREAPKDRPSIHEVVSRLEGLLVVPVETRKRGEKRKLPASNANIEAIKVARGCVEATTGEAISPPTVPTVPFFSASTSVAVTVASDKTL